MGNRTNGSTEALLQRPPQTEPLMARGPVAVFASVLLGIQAPPAFADADTAAAGPRAHLDREQETALALSSCPAPVAAKAGVYVLGDSGYIKVRESRNGFTAIVQHSAPRSQEPQCMDAEGTRTLLPRMLKVAELRTQGKTADDIARIVADGYAHGVFKPPARPGIDYMLSMENWNPAANGGVEWFPPHVMFYGPYLTNADLGLDGPNGGPAFVAGEGSPTALIIVPLGAHSKGDHTPDKPPHEK